MERLIQIAEEGSVGELQVTLDKESNDTIVAEVIAHPPGSSDQSVSLVKAIFGGCRSDSDGIRRKFFLFREMVRQTKQCNKFGNSDVVFVFLMEMETFPPDCLAELLKHFIAQLNNHQEVPQIYFELMPKVFSCISSLPTLSYQGVQYTGAEYKTICLDEMVELDWNLSSLVSLTNCLSEIELLGEDLDIILKKLIQTIKKIDLLEVPSVIYHLLRFNCKDQCRKMLDRLVQFFSELNEKCSLSEPDDLVEIDLSSLRQIEGTSVLHCYHAMSSNILLYRQFVKLIKASQEVCICQSLSSFCLSLSLSLTNKPGFSLQLHEMYRTAILTHYKNLKKKVDFQWLGAICKHTCSVDELLKKFISRSGHEWDNVCEGLVKLCLSLVESHGGKYQHFSKSVTNLACEMLMEVFKRRSDVQEMLLEKIINGMLCHASSPDSPYMNLINKIVRSSPQAVLQLRHSKLRDCFDYLSSLPINTASALLSALQPIVQVAASVQDALLITLRKAMFIREAEPRRLAVVGFLSIINYSKTIGSRPSSQISQDSSISSSSQVSVCVHSVGGISTHSVALEILSNLRRSLTQQAEVRLTFYSNIFEVVLLHDNLKGHALNLLTSQLRKYEDKSSECPLNLELCIALSKDVPYIKEPLAHLVSCLGLCILHSSHTEDSSVDPEEVEAQDMLLSMATKFAECSLQDFNLDKSSDLNGDNINAVKNKMRVLLSLGLLEAFVEFVLGLPSPNCQLAVKLIELHYAISSLLPATKKSPKQLHNTTFTLRFLILCLEKLFLSDEDDSGNSNWAVLRVNSPFVSLISGAAVTQVSLLQDKQAMFDFEAFSLSRLVARLSSLSLTCVRSYIIRGQELSEMQKMNLLETLSGCIQLVCKKYLPQLKSFLNQISIDFEEDSQESSSLSLMDSLQKLTLILLNGERKHTYKEVCSILAVIGELQLHVQMEPKDASQFVAWIKKICIERQTDDLTTSRSLLSLCFSAISRHCNKLPSILKMAAQDIYGHLGDLKDEEVEHCNNLRIVKDSNASSLTGILLTWMDHELEAISWALAQFQPVVTEVQESMEKSVIIRLGMITNSVHDLLQTKFTADSVIEGLVKSSVLLFACMIRLIKHRQLMWINHALAPDGRIEKIVKLTGADLTPLVYAFITYVQQQQIEQPLKKKDASKKGGKISTSAAIAAKTKVLKKTKEIPNLVYHIEEYERLIIALSEKSGVDLAGCLRMSTSRDFRIQLQNLPSESEKSDSNDDSDSENAESGLEENAQSQPSVKRTKRH